MFTKGLRVGLVPTLAQSNWWRLSNIFPMQNYWKILWILKVFLWRGEWDETRPLIFFFFLFFFVSHSSQGAEGPPLLHTAAIMSCQTLSQKAMRPTNSGWKWTKLSPKKALQLQHLTSLLVQQKLTNTSLEKMQWKNNFKVARAES